MLSYLKKHKLEAAVILCLLLFMNFYRYFYRVIGVDAEATILTFGDDLNWTLGLGRFSSTIIRRLMMPLGFRFRFAIVIIFTGWISTCLLYQYCLEKFGGFSSAAAAAFSVIFVTCPIWAEQNYFVGNVVVNVVGFSLSVLAAYYFVEGITGKSGKYCVAATAVSVVAIGVYQAILYMLTANCLIFITLYYFTRKRSVKDYIIDGLKCIAMLVVATGLYFLVSKILISAFYNPQRDYVGYTDAAGYISGRIRWVSVGITPSIKRIWTAICDSLSPDKVYGIPSLLVLWLLVQGILLATCHRNKSNSILLIGNLLLPISVYLANFLTGSTTAIREQVVTPLAYAFLSAFLVDWLLGVSKKYLNKRGQVLGNVAVACLVLAIAGNFAFRQYWLTEADYIRYKNDIALSGSIISEVEKRYPEYQNEKIVFIGWNHWTLPEQYPLGELNGRSMLAWDLSGPVGVNYRIYGFMQLAGHDYGKPSIAEVQEIRQDIKKDPSVFAEDWITTYKGCIVVNLDALP